MVKSVGNVSQEQNMQPFPSTSENNPRPSIPRRKGAGPLLNGFSPSPAFLYQSGAHNIFHSPFSSSPVALQCNKRAHDSSFDQHNQVTQKRPKVFSQCDMPQPESAGYYLDVLFKEAEAESSSTIHLLHSEINQPLSSSEYYSPCAMLQPDGIDENYLSNLLFDYAPIEAEGFSTIDTFHSEINKSPTYSENFLHLTPSTSQLMSPYLYFDANTHSHEDDPYLSNQSLDGIKTHEHFIGKNKKKYQKRSKKIKNIQNSIIDKYYEGTLDTEKIPKDIDELKNFLKKSLEGCESKNSNSLECMKAAEERAEKIMVFYISNWRNKNGYVNKFLSHFESSDSPMQTKSIETYITGIDTILKDKSLDGIKTTEYFSEKEKRRDQQRLKKIKDMQNSIIGKHSEGTLDTEKIPKDIDELKNFLKKSLEGYTGKNSRSPEYMKAAEERAEKIMAFYISNWRSENGYANKFLSHFKGGDSPMHKGSIKRYINGIDTMLKNKKA